VSPRNVGLAEPVDTGWCECECSSDDHSQVLPGRPCLNCPDCLWYVPARATPEFIAKHAGPLHGRPIPRPAEPTICLLEHCKGECGRPHPKNADGLAARVARRYREGHPVDPNERELLEAMLQPIQDPTSAAAVVPMFLTAQQAEEVKARWMNSVDDPPDGGVFEVRNGAGQLVRTIDNRRPRRPNPGTTHWG
jgi:hypothetical protein